MVVDQQWEYEDCGVGPVSQEWHFSGAAFQIQHSAISAIKFKGKYIIFKVLIADIQILGCTYFKNIYKLQQKCKFVDV